MDVQYEQTKAPRFIAENEDGFETIVVPAKRNFFIILVLGISLCGWTFLGVAAMKDLVISNFQPFFAFWLCGWAFGEAFAAIALYWTFFGKEVLRGLGNGIEISYRVPGFTRRKLYRGLDICDLSASGTQSLNKFGSVKFTYGARTIYAAVGLDEAEGQLIVELLRKSLPVTATAKKA